MPRPKQQRTVQLPPRVRGFSPLGYYATNGPSIQLNLDEYEAIRLLDHEGLGQVEAARVMEVSRPTLTRIYDSARKKMARALVEACRIDLEGGDAIYKEPWFRCSECGCRFNNPANPQTPPTGCPLCLAQHIEQLNNDTPCD